MAKLYYEKDNAIYKSETSLPTDNDTFVVDRDVIEGHALVYGKKNDAGVMEIRVSETGIPAASDKTIEELQQEKQDACEHEVHDKDQVCKNCHEAGIEHTEEVIPAVDATCTATGLTAGKKCAVCGEILVEQEVVEKVAHTYANGVCTVCGEADPDYVAPADNE